jgi:hypothetical protein
MLKLGLRYTIENIFKSKYQNWAHILHLELWVKNCGQKGGRKSNWQFDSQAIKPKKHGSNDLQIEFAIHYWKGLFKVYNFFLVILATQLCMWKLWTCKIARLLNNLKKWKKNEKPKSSKFFCHYDIILMTSYII